MTATPNLDILLDPALNDLRSAIRSAFEIGRRFGRQEANHEMKAKLAAALELSDDVIQTEKAAAEIIDKPAAAHHPEQETQASPSPARAPRGSVRPAVMGLLAGVLGATQTEIVRQTGMNENSVRGLLNTLRNEGLAEKNGDVWSLTEAGERDIHDPSGSAAEIRDAEADDQDSGQVPSSASGESSTPVLDWNNPQQARLG